MGKNRSSTAAAEAFANELLPATLRNAARLPFYVKHWGHAGETVRTVADLPLLPPIDKKGAEHLFASFKYSEAPAALMHTSGTSGQITIRCRSTAEIRALLSVRKAPTPRTAEGLIPLMLAVDCANHGQTIGQTASEFGLRAIGFDEQVIDHVIQQLSKRYDFPQYTARVHVLHASLGFLKFLTIALLKRGVEPVTLGVALLSSFGEYVSPHWSAWLQERWGAVHTDSYGMSETVACARRCHSCGRLLFSPEAWQEVVGLSGTGEPHNGIGQLAVTELYPFSQLQPMIRFMPGDLVEGGESNCAYHRGRTFRFLGRFDRALIGDDNGIMNVLIYPAELADALDEIPELARGAEFHGLALDPWSQDLAAPLADMMLDRSDGQRRIVVTVSPRFSITCFPDAATCLKIDIRRTLLGHCRGLAKSLKDGLYDLTVHLEQDGARLRPFTAS